MNIGTYHLLGLPYFFIRKFCFLPCVYNISWERPVCKSAKYTKDVPHFRVFYAWTFVFIFDTINMLGG